MKFATSIIAIVFLGLSFDSVTNAHSHEEEDAHSHGGTSHSHSNGETAHSHLVENVECK